MSTDTLNEREFELVNIIGAELSVNQRDLSRHMDLSLGMVNMLIRRLVSKGYIRINQLNKRKVEYILTPKGFSEKMRKSFRYMLKTINSMGTIKEGLSEALKGEIAKGQTQFTILGESDFSMLVEMVLIEHGAQEGNIIHVQEINDKNVIGTVLVCKEDQGLGEEYNGHRVVDLVHDLAKNYKFPKLEEVGQV